ncbi:hypothetical protein HCN44_006842 [Aphidius gifuensis]|uniref:Uncharacterized protein n=2 Tax=Aphidius gifuensis TaxID=684658 RepID=A0A835CWR0_APHGI|nr:hypothetical protein HCN44_006842 [Aphidius gifuensis]
MKRSCSAPCLADEENGIKKSKAFTNETEPSTREYLQLALARVMELQRAVKDDTYFADDTSDLGESDEDEDTMRQVLTKVFKDLPGSSADVSSIIEKSTRKKYGELNRVHSKSIQLTGYNTCRKIALDFMKTAVKNSPALEKFDKKMMKNHKSNWRRDTMSSDHEIRSRMLRGLDLHLAIKQRDYTYNLMRL